MTRLFDFERNQACPCGSEKKYKRCCLPAVDALYRYWRQWDGEWLAPAFAQVLAACGGLKPNRDEILPERAALEAALTDVRAALSEDDTLQEALMGSVEVLERLLQEDKYFQQLRLDIDEVDDLLLQLDAAVPPEEQASTEADWARETIEAWLAAQKGRGRQPLIMALWQGLRRRVYQPAELTALLFALYLEIMELPAEENPFWFLVAWTSVRETVQVQEKLIELHQAMRASAPEDDTAIQELRALLEQYPVLERRMERHLLTASAPVLEWLNNGTIPVALPAYLFFDGLWRAVVQVAYAGDVIRETVADSESKELRDKLRAHLGQEKMDHDFWLSLAESALGHDYELFTAAVQALLDRWLEGPGQELAEADRDAVQFFRDFFGDLTLVIGAKLYLAVYVLALADAVRRGAAALALPGDEDGPGLTFAECCTRAGALRYAAYLESRGEAAGAAHVREVVARFGTDSSATAPDAASGD